MDSKLISSIYEGDDSSEKARRCAEFIKNDIHKNLDVNSDGKKILGIGYCSPIFSEIEMAYPSCDFMILCPRQLGSFRWRGGKKQLNRTVLADPELIPFSDKQFDLVIVFEMFEYTNSIHNILRDIWRCLADDGKVIIVTRRNFNDFPSDDYQVALELGEKKIKKIPVSIINKELGASIFSNVTNHYISKYDFQNRFGYMGRLSDYFIGDHVVTTAIKKTYITTMIKAEDGKLIESTEYNV